MSLIEFEKKFPLVTNIDSSVKVIIGEQPYKQSLNQIPFLVDGTSSNISIYQTTGNISFLVSDWVKVQDSLEMIFNLLFGHQRSLYALAFLRDMNISPIDFAQFLWEKARVILVNRYVGNNDNGIDIKAFIEKYSKDSIAHILFVGNESENNFPSPSCKFTSAIAIHPSGNNLNHENRRLRYYDNWITCQGNLLKDCNALNLSTFRVFQ